MLRASKALPVALMLLTLVLSSCGGTGHTPSTSGTEERKKFDRFIEHPTAEAWNSLIQQVRRDGRPQTDQLVLGVMQFTEAELRRDLPNSMAQRGNPDEAVDRARIEVATGLRALRRSANEDLWRLLVALVVQDFDDGYHHACAELAVRLFPSRCRELESQLGPERRRILDEERERWALINKQQ